jgi:ribosomal protein S27E
MVKDKTEKQPVKAPQAKIVVQEVKEVPKTKEPEKTVPEQGKPVLTVKEKIDRVVDTYHQDKEELKKQIFQLVQRILYPEQFCPDCDERMFFNPAVSGYNCPNCGYQSSPVTTSGGIARVTPAQRGKVPDVVEKAIAEADEAMKEASIPTIKPTPLGEKIRKLVADRDSGGPAAPTKEDEARIKGADKNVANKINWV